MPHLEEGKETMVGQVCNPWKHMPRSRFGSAGNGFLISLGLGNGSAKEYLLTSTSLFYLESGFFVQLLLF